MNILARILSHGFAIALVLLLAIGFMYRGELFPDMPIPGFLGIEKPATDETEPATAADTDTAGPEAESLTAPDVATETATETAPVAAAPATEPAEDAGSEPPPAGDTEPDTDTAVGTEMPAVVPEAESREPEAETVIPVPAMPETDPGSTSEADMQESVAETSQAVEEGTAVDESVAEAADAIAGAVVPAPPPATDETVSLDAPADTTAPEDTSAVEAAAPATEPAAPETAPAQEEAVDRPAAEEAAPVPPATDADATIESAPAAESPAGDSSAEPVPPAADIAEQTAVADDTEPAEITAPGVGAAPPAMDTAAPAATSLQTTLDMSRPYHVLAAAREAYWLRNLEEAETLYRQLIALEPENPDGYGELGNLYFAQGRWEDAASTYFEAGKRLAHSGHIQEARNLLEVIRGLNSPQADELAGIIAESQ